MCIAISLQQTIITFERKRETERKGGERERERELDSFGSYKVYFSLTIAVPRTARKSQEAGTQRRAISVIK